MTLFGLPARYQGLRCEWMLVTPAVAAEWLTLMDPNNRRPSRATVGMYVRDLENDKWSTNGETIKFDANGVCVDGRHRLLAIVESGIAACILVAWGVEIDGIDRGRGRSPLDSRRMRGESCSQSYLASIKMLDRIENGAWSKKYSDEDCYKIERTYPAAAEWLRENSARSKFPTSVIGAIAFTCPMTGDRAGEFLTSIKGLVDVDFAAVDAVARAAGTFNDKNREPTEKFARGYQGMDTAGAENTRVLCQYTMTAMKQYCTNDRGQFIRIAQDISDYWKNLRNAA